MLMLKLAWRNILRNRRRTVLTLLSLGGAYVLMSLQLSVTEGSYDQVLRTYTRDNSGHAQLTAAGYLDTPRLYDSLPAEPALLDELADLDGVEAVTARIESSALAYGEDKSFPVEVSGIDPEREARLSFLAEKVEAGDYFTAGMDSAGYYPAMIGATVARQLELGVGDDLVLVSQGADGSLANDLYRISAIIGTADSAEARRVFLPLAAAQAFYALPGEAHRLVVLGTDYQQGPALAERLDAWARERWPEGEVRAASWQVVAEEFYRTMQTDKESGQVTLVILVFLVCIGVLNTVLMSVMERTGEFGVLKAIGTSPARLFSLILIETLLLAALACLAGLALVAPLNAWFTWVGIAVEPMEISGIEFTHYRGQLSFYVFAQPVWLIMLMAALVALWPARRAARIVPVDAMRAL